MIPKFRSSVEGLNQEIERLVLVPTNQTADDFDEAVSILNNEKLSLYNV